MNEYFSKWEEQRKQKHISIPQKKTCYLCHRILPISQYNKNRRKKYGIKGICKECQRIVNKKYLQNTIHRYENERASLPRLHEKKCRYCCKILPTSVFSKDKTTRDGLRTICKTCEKQYQKTIIVRWTEKRRQKPQETAFTLFPTFEKQCIRCGKTLSIAFFTKNVSRKDGLSSICKECEQQKNRKYYQLKKKIRLIG